MNTHKIRIRVLLAALCLATFAPSPVSAQEWSAAQKEVWSNVEAYWALDEAGNTDGFLGYFAEDYSGWSVDEALPGGKAMARKFIAHAHKSNKTLLTNLQPTAIKIHGDVAIVHYYWSQIVKPADGKEVNRSGRWTDVLKKQGNKWVLIADHGGVTKSE